MDITTLNQAEEIITNHHENKNILKEIEEFVIQWPFQSTDSFALMNNDINNLINKLIQLFSLNRNDIQIRNAFHCVVFNKMNAFILNYLKEAYLKEDSLLFEKCKRLSINNVSLMQLGSKEEYAIKFPAAVVELSILEEYTSPLQKLNCLCITFDVLYAELKSVLVSMISKYSDKDNDIPIINNDEIYPALLMVIIKSKPMYFMSNLEYIKIFGPDLSNDHVKRQILETFDKAAIKLYNLDETATLNKCCDKLEDSLNLAQLMGFQEKIQNFPNQTVDFLHEKRKEYNDQIEASLSQHLC